MLAGYSLTPASRTEDGRAIFWASLGEIRLFIGRNERRWFVVTGSDRMDSEHFVLAAPSMETVEKYFFGRFCLPIRRIRDLARVKAPISIGEISPKFTIDTRNFEGVERFCLIASDGSVAAVSSVDQITGAAELVKLSLLMTTSIDMITASCLDPDGKPLFQLVGRLN